MSETTQSVSKGIRSALAKAVTGQAFAALLTLPGVGWIFGLPVVSHFIKAIIGRVAEWVLAETAVGLSVLWIMIDMTYEVKDSEEMKNKLKDMLDNPQKYTANEQKKIEDDFDEATINLIALTVKRL